MFKRSLFFLSAVSLALAPSLLLSEEKVDFHISHPVYPDIYVSFKTIFLNNHSDSVIVLSDGSQWIIRNKNAEEVLNDHLANWRSGDDVRIENREPENYKGKFILKNVRSSATYLVDLHPYSADLGESYYISKIDENGYAIATQDGLEFAFGWVGACTVQYWRVNDRIIINKGSFSSNEDYLVIHARSGKAIWASLLYWR